MERIILVGAGRSATALVGRLARLGPVTVVDASSDALAAMRTPASEDAPHPVVRHIADATSRLVLEDLRGDVAEPVALVVAAGNDRVTIEVCRLAADLRYKPLLAVVNEASAAYPCEAVGARAIVKALLVGQVVEQAIRSGGVGMGSDVGFGHGEILEVRVLPSSPAIGVPLARFHAAGWRVAAIYRGAHLVLPTSRTVLAAEDRVLIVGDPKLLPHVGETLRIGLPTFPLLHGPFVLAYQPAGRDAALEAEAEAVMLRTRATGLVRTWPHAVAARSLAEGSSGSTEGKLVEDSALEGSSLAEHLTSLQLRRPGLVVARIPRRSAGDILFGRGGAAAALCNEVGVPVLFPHGAKRYGRVVLGVADGVGDLASADIALDLARMFDAAFAMTRVRLPAYLGAPDADSMQLVEAVAHRAHLYGLKVSSHELVGNPIRAWVRATRDDDLLVLGRRRTIRDSYASPDVVLRFVRENRCAVLVYTEGG